MGVSHVRMYAATATGLPPGYGRRMMYVCLSNRTKSVEMFRLDSKNARMQSSARHPKRDRLSLSLSITL